MAERVESLDELESEFARLRYPDDEEARMLTFIGTPIEERIAEIELRMIWRRNRVSPAKCLQCGSTNIVQIPDTEEFLHPKTGERVVVADHGFASTDSWHAQFSPEGDAISSS